MGRWLTLELARRQGIAMQLELQLPAAFVWDLSRTVLGSLPEQSAFSPTTLTWRLYGWLCEPANLELAPRLAQYLDGGDERRRLSLAAKIADVFDQYLLYRDDWLAAWERGETLDLGPDEAWQALLWRELTKDGHPHRARLLGDLLQRLYRDEPLPDLPERLLVFGISSLPPHHLRVLDGLARHIDVVVCALNPSREAWGEIRDIRELAAQPESGVDDWYGRRPSAAGESRQAGCWRVSASRVATFRLAVQPDRQRRQSGIRPVFRRRGPARRQPAACLAERHPAPAHPPAR